MKVLRSLVIITKNAGATLDRVLGSVKDIVDEIVVVDDRSTDNTLLIAKAYGAKVFKHHEYDLGKQRLYAMKKAKGKWILVLDADEWLTKELKKEIATLLHCSIVKYDGFYIPFQTHFLGKPLRYGGENYKKLILFRKDSVMIKPALVHEKYELIKGKTGYLKHRAYHYSYQSITEMFKIFTDYAIRDAEQKIKNGEKSSFKKIFIYPIHMFWARFINDKGYKDGLRRLPLDIGFAYMEFLTYLLLLFMTI